MTETDWLACTDVKPMLEFLRGKTNERKLRLFGVACCRRVWHLIGEEVCRRAVDAAEQYAERIASPDELAHAFDEAFEAVYCLQDTAYRKEAAYAASQVAATDIDLRTIARSCADAVGYFAGYQENRLTGPPGDAVTFQEARKTEVLMQVSVLRCIFGNPIRPSTPESRRPVWVSEGARTFAAGIYSESAYVSLPVLADALEEAGCTDGEILAHLRGPGPHVRGCWALDLILGKE